MNEAPLVQNKDDIFVLSEFHISDLKVKALQSPLQRARINVHRDMAAKTHEMIIAITHECALIPPHRHKDKSESFHIIEGEMFILIFADDGGLLDIILLSPEYSSPKYNRVPKKGRYYRLDSSHWHSVFPLSQCVVFHETTTGPFIRGEQEFADFVNEGHLAIKQFYCDLLKQFDWAHTFFEEKIYGI